MNTPLSKWNWQTWETTRPSYPFIEMKHNIAVCRVEHETPHERWKWIFWDEILWWNSGVTTVDLRNRVWLYFSLREPISFRRRCVSYIFIMLLISWISFRRWCVCHLPIWTLCEDLSEYPLYHNSLSFFNNIHACHFLVSSLRMTLTLGHLDT